ncbi:coth protein-domain-containing protein [Fennellomyces sp. T-0311]|nr:coth protein-domain-containing protein [Fennellomyces sp. T-0311]
MKKLIPWFIAALLGATYAHPVTYKVVISPPNAESIVGVAIGQDIYGLSPDPKVPMLYTGTGPSSQPYRYVILDNTTLTHYERFERPAIEKASQTYYEFYGRPWNKLAIPSIPRVYDFHPKGIESVAPVEDPYAAVNDPAASDLFQDGIVATIHFKADDSLVQAMHTKKFDKLSAKVTGDMTYISYNDVKQFSNVTLKVGGHSSRTWAKVPYKIKIPKKSAPEGLYRRWSLKLRSESTDPTMMREKLYNDLLEASGVIAARGVYARLYINNMPVGLYYLVDDSSSSSFMRETMHTGEPKAKTGHIIQGDAGKGDYPANLAYLGENPDAYDIMVYDVKSSKNKKQHTAAMTELIALLRFLKTYEPSNGANNASLVEEWQSKADVISYIRQLAVEWVAGNWDAIQYSGNNFAMYQHPNTKQWTFIPVDFDYSFGNGLERDQDNLMKGEWPRFTDNRKIFSYLWEKLKSIPYFVQIYEDTIKNIDARASNPDVLIPRIDGLAYMLQREVLWDTSLERMTRGVTRPWQASEYLQHIESGTEIKDEWIGLKQWVYEKNKAIANMESHVGEPHEGIDNMPDVPVGRMAEQDTINEMIEEVQ